MNDGIRREPFEREAFGQTSFADSAFGEADSYQSASGKGVSGYAQTHYTSPIQTQAVASPYSASAATSAQRQSISGPQVFLLGFLGAALACALAFGGFFAWQHFSEGPSKQVVLGSSSSVEVTASDDDPTLAEAVAAKALPSVVAIDVYQKESSLYGSAGNAFGFGRNSDSDTLVQSSLGSGVVLSDDGYIITNYHVIEGADTLKVTVEGEEYVAEAIGGDASSDVAVIKAKDASGLTSIELGDSDALEIGEWVMTLGSPFGLEQSVATGIVSATSRSQILDSSEGMGSTVIYPNLIQTDAAINPGNSGGALVDAQGKLVGINTLITSYSGSYSGVGFAIPVNYAAQLAQQIIEGETPSHAQLGVSLYSVTAQIAKSYGLSSDSGAYISSIVEGSGADEAGLEVGDIVVAFDGEAVSSASDLTLAVRTKNPGDEVVLTVNRKGKEMDIDVVLGSDANAASASTQENQRNNQGWDSPNGNDNSWFDWFWPF